MPDTSDLNSLPKHGEGPVVISSPLDKPDNADLKAAFAAWEPEPVLEEEAPPSAPGAIKLAVKPEVDEPAAEPEAKPAEEREHSTRPSSRPSEVETAPVEELPLDEPDLEIDGQELDRNASPSQKGQFRQLKEITKKFRSETVTPKITDFR